MSDTHRVGGTQAWRGVQNWGVPWAPCPCRLAQKRGTATLTGCGFLQVPWRRNWASIKIRKTFRWVNINTSGTVTKGLSGC